MRQSIVTDHVEKLCKILEKAHETDSVVPMNHVFSSLTGDVTFNFAYGSNLGNLDKGVSTNRFYQSGKESLAFLHVLHYMPIVVLLKITPEWLVGIISPSAKPLCDLKDIIREESRQALDADVSDRKKNTVFDTLIDPSLPPEERELERLVDAGFELMTAGIDSAASTLAFTLFHLLSNEDMLAKLRYELDQNPQSTEWSDLEKLPYLVRLVSFPNYWRLMEYIERGSLRGT
jgi:cytochrome P450